MLLLITRRGITREVCKVPPDTYRTLTHAIADAWADLTPRAPYRLHAAITTAETLALGPI